MLTFTDSINQIIGKINLPSVHLPSVNLPSVDSISVAFITSKFLKAGPSGRAV